MKTWENKDLKNIDNEIWKDIPNYEGLYQVSNFGRVKSLEREYMHPIRGNTKITEKILSQMVDKTLGYCKCALYKERIQNKVFVHRLVGFAFIENIENKPQINHKDGIRTNNIVSNLEWNTNKENNIHSYRELGRKPPRSQLGKSGKLHHLSKRVYCPTLSIYFGSSREASRELGINQRNISDVCLNKRIHCNGMVFNYI